ncbi:NAD-dependent epimerase/dehydratase family protein [Nigerium massiliense]|uniref:NAD-dependent epimerase/dehydratase family protein n=1 Tax=Nigerium massiliense TaxID=1522317 RepID=UPI000694AEFE|nr:NAD-dependent epimerase/dehydratase family protein [Nigerium massiliense]
MTAPLTWVVGAGGLLGQHVVAALDGRAPRFAAPPIPWSEPERARAVLADAAASFVGKAGDQPWQVIWCAGAGVTGTSKEDLDNELAALSAALEGLGGGPRGAVFFASSAGGVYAGVGFPPYTEVSPVRPLAPYGFAKLEAERIVTDWAMRTGTSALIGRIANIYGPGQNLDKPQGLVSQLCASFLKRRASHIWSSLDTLRDYVFVADCAELVLDALDRLRAETSDRPQVVTKIFASGRSMSIASVIGELRLVFRRRPLIVLGASPTSAMQARDLSMHSLVWPELDRRSWTPFTVGAMRTLDDLRRQD